jgi:NADH dehydrogenase
MAKTVSCELDKQERIRVNAFCQLPENESIYVVGDMAHFDDHEGNPLPAVAQVAIQQGKYAAESILRQITEESVNPFSYNDRGSMAVIGRKSAVALLGKFEFSGYLAWILWLFIHLMYLVGFQNKLLVFIQWAYNYFTRNNSARLIANYRIEKEG